MGYYYDDDEEYCSYYYEYEDEAGGEHERGTHRDHEREHGDGEHQEHPREDPPPDPAWRGGECTVIGHAGRNRAGSAAGRRDDRRTGRFRTRDR